MGETAAAGGVFKGLGLRGVRGRGAAGAVGATAAPLEGGPEGERYIQSDNYSNVPKQYKENSQYILASAAINKIVTKMELR